jgi:ADP-ribose pyrophosphatase
MKKIIPKRSVLIPDDAEAVFHGNIFDVYQWPQALFDGSSHVFEMLKRPDTVVAICIVDGQILVIDDEQPHFGSRQSFPGGRVDDSDDSIEAAAKREVAEETGYSFKQWRLIQVHQPHNKIEWFVYLFIAWDEAAHDEPHLDPGEKITTKRYDFADIRTLALNKTGYIGDVEDLFRDLSSSEQLLTLPVFEGQSVDR